MRGVEEHRGARNVSMSAYGRYGATSPPDGVPDRQVRAGRSGAASCKPRPTPKQADANREATRVRGERVYDAVNAAAIWGIIDNPTPNPPDGPYRPEEGLGEETIPPKKRGRDIVRKAVDIASRPRFTSGYPTPEWRSAFSGKIVHCNPYISRITTLSDHNNEDGAIYRGASMGKRP